MSGVLIRSLFTRMVVPFSRRFTSVSKGDIHEAVSTYMAAVESPGESPSALMNLGFSQLMLAHYFPQPDPEDAFKTARNALMLDGDLTQFERESLEKGIEQGIQMTQALKAGKVPKPATLFYHDLEKDLFCRMDRVEEESDPVCD